ncbi:MFS transporter [Bifidobacterium avesanii]|uniref:MFS transporter n=1 Tax=Bifidobacterium avesanii TaxID=1798157 RepID=A0A7K3TJD2_9BIFI|nr:MFS transporter [Bifidobacterium avesanii]KAB8289589.1 multidrug-efflux transporter [Bifidobacterium avesanii]NEG79142.1 MFS transporter [Bifidobacterium avesanii]
MTNQTVSAEADELEQDEAMAAESESESKSSVTNEQQPKLPYVLCAGLFLGPLTWMGPVGGGRNVLTPQIFSDIDPAGKVAAVALLSSFVSLAGLIANFVFGALSDVTRTRWGKRKPYIVGGLIIQALLFVFIANAGSIPAIIGGWVLVAIAENAVAASMVAQQSDRIAPRWRGTASMCWGVGWTCCQVITIIASQFLDRPQLGMYVLAGISLVLGLGHVLLMNEKSNLDEPRMKFDSGSLLSHFFLPIHGARDYYLALGGKLLMVIGGTCVGLYQLYIFTDYIHLDINATKLAMSTMTTISLITGIIFGIIAGPLADKFGRLKAPVAISVIFIGIAAVFPFFFPYAWAMYVFGIISGIANGVYNSVDGALNLAVLPNKETAGKDLGIINFANTLSQIIGTAIAGGIITVFGSYRAVFPAAFVIALLGACLFFMIKKVK